MVMWISDKSVVDTAMTVRMLTSSVTVYYIKLIKLLVNKKIQHIIRK